MYCPRCGTKTIMGQQGYCRECGAAIDATAGTQGHDATHAMPPHAHPFVISHVIEKDNTMRTLLMAGGLLLLLPLAIPLVIGALVASFVTGAALIAILFKAIPLLAVALVVYLILNRQRRGHYYGPR